MPQKGAQRGGQKNAAISHEVSRLRRFCGAYNWGKIEKITQIRSLCRWVYSTVRYVLLSCGLFFSIQTVNRGFNLVCETIFVRKNRAQRFLNVGKIMHIRFSSWMPSPATTRRSWSLEGGDAVFVFFKINKVCQTIRNALYRTV